MDLRTTRAFTAAAVLALGACADLPTHAPAAPPAGAAARTVSGPGITLVPNAVRYRDNGGKPATGRAGSAAMQALALLGKDGRTEFEYRSIPADPDQWWLQGTITRAQVKALDADGRVMFTYNDNHLNAHGKITHFGSLVHGQSLQVQANLTGADPHRTDVVTVTERIKLRPDLAVRLEMAPQVPAVQQVPVLATLSELNGDVGASTACRLLVDGREVDSAWGVWVDAGDAVTCAFSHSFAPGTHQVQVDLLWTVPGDWDTSNNRSQVVQVEAVGGPTAFSYFASANASSWDNETTVTSRWHNPATGIRGESEEVRGDSGSAENAYVSGFIERGLTGNVSVELSQTSGGRVLHADAWDVGELAGCTVRYGGPSSFHMCTSSYGGWTQTWFTYFHNAGTVTYHSRYFYREWDEGTGEDVYYYHFNDSYQAPGAPLAGFGDDFGFHVRVTDAERTLTMDSDFPLAPTQFSWGDSFCSSYTEPWDGYTSETCYAYSRSEQSRGGYDSGPS